MAGGWAGTELIGGLRNGLSGGLCFLFIFNLLIEVDRTTASVNA